MPNALTMDETFLLVCVDPLTMEFYWRSMLHQPSSSTSTIHNLGGGGGVFIQLSMSHLFIPSEMIDCTLLECTNASLCITRWWN